MRSTLVFVLVAVSYYLTGIFGLGIDPVGGFATLVWPPAGIAVAAALLCGPWICPAIVVGAFFVNLTSGALPLAALGIGIGNAAEAWVAVFLLRHLASDFRVDLLRVRDVLQFAVLAAGVSTAVSATVGTSVLVATGTLSGTAFGATWMAWWLGDMLGVLIVGAFLVAWARVLQPTFLEKFSQWLEMILIAGITAVLAMHVFQIQQIGFLLSPPNLYLILPSLFWAAFRFGLKGATAGVLITSTIAIYGTARHVGPFWDGSVSSSLMHLQSYLVAIGLTTSLLSAAIAEKLAALALIDRRKNEFLALLAHELRNPLAPIASGVGVLRNPNLNAAVKERTLAVIEKQLGNAQRLIDDLLEVSRASHGKIALHKSRVNISALIGHVGDNLRPTFASKQQTLTLNLPQQELWAEVDETRCEQIVTNLLQNAGKYTAEHGRITLDLTAAAGEVTIDVSDNGVGMDAEMVARAFDLFSQSDKSLARSKGGLGIGLTMVKKLAELHGGHVTVKSRPGVGSTFTVVLPVGAAAEATAPVPASSPPVALTRSMDILIVEDNIDAAEMYERLMRQWGHNVTVVHDGREALAALEIHRPDLVFLDIGLPDIDGYEIAKRIRQDPRWAMLTLVAMTGYGQEEDRQKADAAGFNNHLLKPTMPSELKKFVQGIAARASR